MLFETESHCKQDEALKLNDEWKENEKRLVKPMIDQHNADRLAANLDNYDSLKRAIGTHKLGHDQHHLETTYICDYVHPYPEKQNEKSEKAKNAEFEASVDNSWAYRRMQSQFSDIDAPKREGINTFHVQHGIYPNQEFQSKVSIRNKSQIFQ
jgi:hypothetical protein